MGKNKKKKNSVKQSPKIELTENTENTELSEEIPETNSEDTEITPETNSVVIEKSESEKSAKNRKHARTLPNPKNTKEHKTKLFLVLAFFVPFLIMGVVFAKAGVYPFGDRQVMYSDCKQQYLPFLKEFQRKLQTGESMLYSWHNGFGTNFIAMIGYYIASPLNLLTLFIPIKYIREAMAVFMMIKVGCASLFMAIFLKHVYRRNDISLVAFGCCYAFCDFIMGYYWNVIWLDSVALLPMVALGVYYVVNEKKYRLYIISLALAFFSSYYIGYMICVFVILWFVVTNVVKGNKLVDWLENILRMALYSVIALAMTLPVTLTSYIQLANTVGTEDSFPDKIEFYNNFMEMLANLLSFHEPTTMEGLPNIGSGVVCVLLIAIFVRAKTIPLREKIANLALLVFLFVSLNINSLDYIWHGFHFPNLIPYRFAFLFSFVLIAIAYRAFTVFVELDKSDIIGLCIVTVAMVCISVFYLDKKAIIGSLIIGAIYILFMTFYEFDLLDRRLLTIFASLLIIIEMCIECSIGINTVGTTNHTNYPDQEEAVAELIDYAESENGEEFFRIEQTNYSTKNDGMIYGYNGIGQFSSTSYKSIIEFTSKFGMVSKRSSYQYLLTSPVTSMFTGVKYVISRDGYTANEISLTEYKKSSNGIAKMYLNEYYLPIGYMADNDVNYISMQNSSVFKDQNEVFSFATGVDEDVYTLLRPDSFDCLNMEHSESSEGMYSYTYSGGVSNGEINVIYKAPKDGMLYAWANVKSANNVTVISDTINHTYETEAQRYIFPLGYYHEGDEVKLHVDATSSGTNIIGAAYLNTDVLDEGYARLSDEPLKVTNYNSTKIEGTIDVQNDGTFVTSIPYEKGWTLYVDGTKQDTKEVMGVFLASELTAGTHQIKLTYIPEGFVPGVIIATIAFIGFVAMCILDFRRKKAV